jgi:hypothetical protein
MSHGFKKNQIYINTVLSPQYIMLGFSSVIFIISDCCCGVVHRIFDSGNVGCDVVSIVTTRCLSE